LAGAATVSFSVAKESPVTESKNRSDMIQTIIFFMISPPFIMRMAPIDIINKPYRSEKLSIHGRMKTWLVISSGPLSLSDE
jgi:hypothetical protein